MSEMMNAQAMGGIVAKVAPGVRNWFPDLPELEAVFPAGTIDRSAEPIYPEVGNSSHIHDPSICFFIVRCSTCSNAAGTKVGRVRLGGKKQIRKCHPRSC